MKTLLAIALMAAMPALMAQNHPKPPKSTRLYIFDCGLIKGLSPATFNLKPEEVKATAFVVPRYLVVNPRGTLLWDVGVVPDSAFQADGAPVT